jgi:broad specificity phosphatase PhoE
LTTFFLIRHASTDAIGRYLSGTAPGTPINDAGHEEVTTLVERLRNVRLSAVIAGPLERTQQTALPIAESHGLRVQTDPLFSEFAVGDWTLRPLNELAGHPEWQRFNTARSVTRAPKGELMLEVQQRAVVRLLELAEEHPSTSLAIVSHGDVIRAVLMYFLGMPIDLFLRLDVLPATVNVVTFDGHTPVVRQVNGGIDPPVG